MIRRLRVKFICINMAVVTVMLLAILGMLLHFTHDNLEQQSIRVMQSVMADRASPGRPGEFPRQAQLPYFYVSVNTLGELSASFGGYYDLTDTAAIQEIITLALNSDDQTGILKDYSLRFQKRTTPFGQTIVFVDMSSELATMRSLTNTCVIIGVLSFAVFLGLSFLLARWAVKPVETAWNQQRQFVADASHELKTPLTVIMTNAELLNSPDFDETRRSQFAAHILTMSRQMRQLIEEMLDLARTDSGQNTLIFSLVDLSRLISDAVLPFEPVFFEAGLTLAVDIQPGLTVRGSQQHLRQTVDILLDNARKYAAPSGEISVTLTRCGGRCRLAVSNPGPAISRTDLQNIFKRFYRADKAHTQRGSYGLGLSIAQNIVLRHRGRIWAESKNGRNTFFVELPLK